MIALPRIIATPLTRKDTPMTPMPAEKNVLTVLESCFKIVPGMEAELAELQGRFWPVATSQPGFISVQVGTIVNSTWLYFGVRFESKNQMDAWHRHPGHQAIQKLGYAKLWTALYLRKWRVALPGEAPGERLMCETRLVTKSPLTPEQLASLKPMLDGIGDAGALRFETLTGEYEPQPYQFVAPVQITPAVDGTMYSLITHWSSASAIEAWRESAGYRLLPALGDVSSETFVPAVEDEVRDRLRPDRLQRDWVLAGHA
jgi:heme-degrading monooxygenase HmoA